jgi:hypothetical protein
MTEAGRLAKMQKSQQLVECAVKRDMMGGMEEWAGEQEGVVCRWHPGEECRTLQGVFSEAHHHLESLA